MDDIAPGLLEELRRLFLEQLGEEQLTAENWPEAYAAADRVGEALASALGQGLSDDALPDGRMYWNIADRVVRPLLEEEHTFAAGAAQAAQQALNAAAGLGLRAVAAPVNSERIEGILNRLAAAERYEDIAWLLGEPVRLLARAAVDETVRRNVEFQGKAGLRPRVVRTAESGACKWCRALAGSYNYPDVPQDVYRRHENCRCQVEYDPRDGKRQDVWTKQWTEPGKNVKIKQNVVTASDPVERAVRQKKGTPMDIHSAVSGANPNYAQGWEYQNNCQRCVQAYELRRRGYDVVAKPRPRTGNTIGWGSECFIQPGQYQNPSQAYVFGKTAKEVRDVVGASPDGARYSIYVQWKGSNTAHVFIAEKENGVVRYVDPQSGREDVSFYFSRGRQNRWGYFRMDDKPITSDLSTIRETVDR